MNWWFISYIMVQLIYAGFVLARHGEKKKEEEYDFAISIISILIMMLWLILMGVRL